MFRTMGTNWFFYLLSNQRINRDTTAILEREIKTHDPLDVTRLKCGKSLEIGPAEINITHHHFGHTQSGCLAIHRLAGIDLTDHQLTHDLAQLTNRDSLLPQPPQFAMDRGRRGFTFRRVASV